MRRFSDGLLQSNNMHLTEYFLNIFQALGRNMEHPSSNEKRMVIDVRSLQYGWKYMAIDFSRAFAVWHTFS